MLEKSRTRSGKLCGASLETNTCNLRGIDFLYMVVRNVGKVNET
jgi:hypothetical protein